MVVTESEPHPDSTSDHEEEEDYNSSSLGNGGRGIVHYSSTFGKGQWAAWCRNFNTPLLAFLDLFDNAVDACFVKPGIDMMRHEVAHYSAPMPTVVAAAAQGPRPPQRHYHHQQHQPLTTAATARIHVSRDPYGTFNGIVMRNSCREATPPIDAVLNVNGGTKKDKADQIGENGVGVKQACANMSDLSFILIKTPNRYGFGILMGDLQQEQPCFPSMEFQKNAPPTHSQTNRNSSIPSLYDQLHNACVYHSKDIGKAIASYGNGDPNAGIDQLTRHFDDMSKGVWNSHPYVFTVLLVRLRHGAGSKQDEQAQGEANDQDEGDNYRGRALNIMKELADELPKKYLHIPQSMTIVINKQRLNFRYWEHRLAELTQFVIGVDKQNSLQDNHFWKTTTTTTDGAITTTTTTPTHLRIFCGFDVYRLGDTAANNKKPSASLMVYSRESGRLIKEYPDARNLLELTHGGSDFCQGLTILLDDYQNTLPLSPTKQDLSFGLETYGKTHEQNLWAMVGAVAHLYWHIHHDQFGKSKKALTMGVEESLIQVERYKDSFLKQPSVVQQASHEDDNDEDANDDGHRQHHQARSNVPDQWGGLGDGNFNVFEGIQWRKSKNLVRCIQTVRQGLKKVNGRCTLFPLKPPRHVPKSKAGRKKSTGTVEDTVGDTQVDNDENNHDNEDDDDDVMRQNHEHARAKRKRSMGGIEESKMAYESPAITSARIQKDKKEMRDTIQRLQDENFVLKQERARDKNEIERLLQQIVQGKQDLAATFAASAAANTTTPTATANGDSVDSTKTSPDMLPKRVWQEQLDAKELELDELMSQNEKLREENDKLEQALAEKEQERKTLERQLSEARKMSSISSSYHTPTKLGNGHAAAAAMSPSSLHEVKQLKRHLSFQKELVSSATKDVELYKALAERQRKEIDVLNGSIRELVQEKTKLQTQLHLQQLQDDEDDEDEVVVVEEVVSSADAGYESI
jgi:hypothetical protein